MSKHTLGPWRLEADKAHFYSMTAIVGGSKMNSQPHSFPGYEMIVQVGGTADVFTLEANARLIAAAPDLLEACKVALGIIGFGAEHDQISAAIAKAKGETK